MYKAKCKINLLCNYFAYFQGEKAYSCQQCGTRFTYRNGLIKHTKLNRCPKKIVTPDGETIIKKRSRWNGNAANAKATKKVKVEHTKVKEEKNGKVERSCVVQSNVEDKLQVGIFLFYFIGLLYFILYSR